MEQVWKKEQKGKYHGYMNLPYFFMHTIRIKL